MYVCWECWRAEMKFKWAFFFQVLVEIFSTRDECRDIFENSKIRKIRKIRTIRTILACGNVNMLAHVRTELLFCTPNSYFARQFTFPHAYACKQRKCLILKSVKSNSLIHKKINWSINLANYKNACLLLSFSKMLSAR